MADSAPSHFIANSKEDQDNGQPQVRCICSLCNCGRHSCSTFESESIKASTMNKPETSDEPKNEERGYQIPMHQPASPNGCGCLPLHDQQRYLASSDYDVGNQTPEASEAAIKGDVLHVLVTRPEIARKPRDNIMFRGDMDLKTTFETSYEALAKMRLDYWKKYQQFRDQCGQSPIPLMNNGASTADTSVNRVDSDRVDPVSKPAQPDVSRIYRASNGVSNSVQPARQVKMVRVDQGAENSPSAAEAMVAESAPHIHVGSQVIDSDLSPIIVFDPNLNRLERVGVRKRSKHRPSTSLRAGSRGLFGDQKPETPLKNSDGNQSRSDRLVDAELATSNAPKKSRSGLESIQGQRHLGCSVQADKLVYSDRNIAVNSKRKVWDNVNMEDHIRDHNIVASGSSRRNMRSSDCNLNSDELARGSNTNEAEEDLKIARQEEAEAVEELQKLTVAESDSSEEQSRNTSQNRERTQAKLYRVCQNQNFDISLNNYPENNPYTSTDTNNGTSGRVVRPLSENLRIATPNRHARIYNNLFRESPDFVLATSGLITGNPDLENSNPVSLKSETKDALEEQLDSEVQNEFPASEMSNIIAKGASSALQQDCRISKLDQDFCYIGSKMGHKYFVENLSGNQ